MRRREYSMPSRMRIYPVGRFIVRPLQIVSESGFMVPTITSHAIPIEFCDTGKHLIHDCAHDLNHRWLATPSSKR